MGALDTDLLASMRAGASKGRPYLVGAKTAAYTVKPQDCYGGIITNEGASGSVTLSLPVAEVGMSLLVYLMAAQAVVIDPNGSTDAIILAGVQDTAGDAISADAAGEQVFLVCVTANEWIARDVVGTWTAA